MTPLFFLQTLGLPALLGIVALLAVGERPRGQWLSWIGAVFPTGFLLTGLSQLATMALGAPASGPAARLTVGALILGLGALAFWRRGRAGSSADGTRCPNFGVRASGALITLVVLAWAMGELAYLDLPKLAQPIASGDSASIWTLRAKMLFDHGVVDADLGATLAESRGAHHLDYPLLNPLLQVWAMSAAGDYLDAGLRWPSFAWHLSLIFTLIGATRRWLGRLRPALGELAGAPLAILYLSLPGIAVVASGTMMDLVVGLGFLGFTERVLRFAHRVTPRPGRNDFALIAVWAGVLFWSKNEGMMLGAAALIAALLGLPWRRILPRLATPRAGWILLVLVVLGAQLYFNRTLDYENDLLTGGHGRDPRPLTTTFVENLPERAGIILGHLGEGAIDFEITRGLFLLYLAAIILGGTAAWRSPARFLALAIPGGWAGYVCAYVISHENLPWHLFTSAYRTTGQLLPAITLFLAVVLGGAFPKIPEADAEVAPSE